MAKKENTQSCFQRGLISLLILALLDQEDMYGYQIVQEITERSGGAIVTEEGSLYPVLYKLQDQGMLSGRKGIGRQTDDACLLSSGGARPPPSAGVEPGVPGDHTGCFSNYSGGARKK